MMSGDAASPALEMRAISCVRPDASVADVSLSIPSRRLSVIRGEVGSGKELLLKIAGLLEPVDAGDLMIEGQATEHLDERDRAELRRRHFGYLFSSPFLLPAFTVIENVVMPMFKVLDACPSDARARAEELLTFAGVKQLAQDKASDLGSFDQRRVALARALATGPSVLLVEDVDADANPDTQRQFANLLREACVKCSITVIVTASPGWMPSVGDSVFDVCAGKLCVRPQELPRG